MQAACIRNLTDAARSEQLFRINGFSATQETSKFIAPRMWAVGGHDWRIDFHPNYRKSSSSYDTERWVVFRVILASGAGDGVAATFSCRLVDPDSKNDPSPAITSARFYQNKSQEVFLTTRRNLVSSGFVKDECFLVRCAIAVLPGKAAAPAANVVHGGVAPPSSDLQKHFGELLQSQKGADVAFLVAGERVPAHRCVLAARSPVFMAELCGDMKAEKASQCVEVKDMDVQVFKAMLHFIYTDTSPKLDQQGEPRMTMARHLLEAADRYGLRRLKGMCVEKVCTEISVETVATTLALAEQHGCSKLKARCMEFILANPGNLHVVSVTEGYKHLETSCPSVLTELLKLMAGGRR
ncbi:hypothetical protein ACP70R_043497 [Stipagrostis hirtigluma subsp. patula]